MATSAKVQIEAARKKAKAESAERIRARFCMLCKRRGLPAPVPEYRFHETRKWRMDYAWPDHGVALEVEGGVFSGGRHTRGTGFMKDMEKYNEASANGFFVLRTTPSLLFSDANFDWLERTIKQGQNNARKEVGRPDS